MTEHKLPFLFYRRLVIFYFCLDIAYNLKNVSGKSCLTCLRMSSSILICY